eukprot:6438427-Amphidinium_carterae.1
MGTLMGPGPRGTLKPSRPLGLVLVTGTPSLCFDAFKERLEEDLPFDLPSHPYDLVTFRTLA